MASLITAIKFSQKDTLIYHFSQVIQTACAGLGTFHWHSGTVRYLRSECVSASFGDGNYRLLGAELGTIENVKSDGIHMLSVIGVSPCDVVFLCPELVVTVLLNSANDQF